METKTDWASLLLDKDNWETWDTVTGCSKISEGCRYCYAEKISLDHGFSRLPWTRENAPNNVAIHPLRTEKPLNWLKPKAVLVNGMSDTFHELVPFTFIDQIFETILATNQHFYQILTKRPERILEWLTYSKVVDANNLPDNVGFGVTAEDQKNLLLRVPLLAQLKTAGLRFISCEPLLSMIKLTDLTPEVFHKIQWVIIGGEIGTENARPVSSTWVRKIKNDCVAAKIPFLFKQWGEWLPADQVLDPAERNMIRYYSSISKLNVAGEEQTFYKTGKKRAGRLLDNVLWNDFPTEIGNSFRPPTANKLQPSLFD